MHHTPLRLEPGRLDARAEARRAQVRRFLDEARAAGQFEPSCDCWVKGFSRAFSRSAGAAGLLGITWPRAFGGQEGSPLERFVVIEELLAAGAPVGAHWIAERQMGPSILRFGNDRQKAEILPRIARGELVMAAGYSEPDVGSDLASVKTRAERVEGGWRLTGTKVWTTQGHHADYMFVLCRTAREEDRHAGLSILIVQLPAEGVRIRPILLLTGEHHFNEVSMDGVFVPDAMVLGQVNDGWNIISSELVHERSGPERFMSTFPLLVELVRQAQATPQDARALVAVGELVARLRALRNMSISIATALEQGQVPQVEAALVKDLGTRFEGDVAETARLLFPALPSLHSADLYARYLAQSVMHAPAFTLRGGANEVLRGIVARGLGMR
ncbi:acyl-CoA dehydrogenase family protein [Pseudorhodoferax sp.]|uniref:acyl-CoA dehydrogenase family protein n=1 Tax=Pseudorhodoferax sp. TaxID=1993553 RepID=UPI002DD63BC3|nr:acyl-CoA dehydrogenase family protein [Pseudorhodoferax sp.]